MIPEVQFLRQIIPDVTMLHGVRCRPYALGHSMILKRLGSPFVEDEFYPHGVSYAEFLEALFVLAHTWEQNMELQGTPFVLSLQKRWHRSWSLYGFRRVNLQDKAALLRHHIENGLDWPELKVEESKGDRMEAIECSSPRSQVLIVHCLQKLNLSLSEIMNLPFGFTYWLYATASEMTGLYTLDDESEYEQYQRMANALQEKIDRGEIKV